MIEHGVLEQLAELIGGAFAFKADAFRTVVRLPSGQTIALLVVLLAGFSLAIGQGIILFINRVQPIRFVFSLLLNAVLFTCGFLFLVGSTWLIGWLPGLVTVPLGDLVKVWALSYAPLLFSFLGALPYAGVPLLNLLSVWRLLDMVVGFSAIAPVNEASAFVHVAFGWFALQLLEGTIGQPIAKFGQRLAERVAGVDLADNQDELAAMVRSGLDALTAPDRSTALPPSSQATPRVPVTERSPLAVGASPQGDRSAEPLTPVQSSVQLPSESTPLWVGLSHRLRDIPQALRLGFSILGMLLLFLLITLLLRPVRDTLFSWHDSLPRFLRWVFDLAWIGVVAFVFAGLLAPLEALGWWAGWYGDDLATQVSAIPTPEPDPEARPISRYVVYLDGVGQSGQEHTPDVAEFLQALQAVLPPEMHLVQGLMMYSVLNRPLDEDRPLAWIWRWADKMRWQNPAALLGTLVNLRNVLIVAVSADKRYGPIYNQGITQVIYNGLIEQGYQPGSGVPITLIGYSGGGEMSVAAGPHLKRILASPIEVISLGGVMSANKHFLQLEHLYHLVGDQDTVERIGPIIFPGRWKLFFLSYWNRAKRKGKISIISLGPMGHQVPGGMMDPQTVLPNGQSCLQTTIGVILSILEGRLLTAAHALPKKTSNYAQYKQADFNDYRYYPLTQTVDLRWYRPIAPWMGRLILPLPDERAHVKGAWFEVHHAAQGYESLVGQTVILRWVDRPGVHQVVQAVTHDVHFSADADYSSRYGGSIHPDRLNHWRQVNPLESLAGSHPTDDLIVMLEGAVTIQEGDGPILQIIDQPVEITGRYYGLVQFVAPIAGDDRVQVRHFNPVSRQFDGWRQVVRLPQVVLAQAYGSYPSTTRHLEQTGLNETGWYIYGAKDANGEFVVQAWAPRSLFRLQPDRVVVGNRASYRYIRQESWANVVAQKGQIASVLCLGQRSEESIQAAIDQWQEGDRALVLHVYGGIGGQRKEPAAATPLFFGHFAYGLAHVIRDPLSQDLRFEIQYYQVYAHNTDGLTAGTLHWSRYMGDRQFGWLGTRPTCDILVKFEPFTGYLDVSGTPRSALNNMVYQLQAMTARYRIGDGTGATYVGAANNCAQDSNQALMASIRLLSQAIASRQTLIQTWLENNPAEGKRYQQLLVLGQNLQRQLQPWGSPRSDWETNEYNLGTTLEDQPIRNLLTGLGSWRTLLPRKASDTVVQVFLEQGATVWVLRTNQIGGYDPEIEPIAPMTL